MMDKNRYAVIMAGGIGSRFWPMSRTDLPKQFLDILGTGETLIQMTYRRFKAICPEENILIVTNDQYRDLVKEQLSGIQDNQILCEPSRRNTAPCIAYATYKIQTQNPDAVMVIAPSDHLITKEEDFNFTIDTAIEQAAKGKNIVTLGIKPSRPDTGYGYIQFNEADSTLVSSVRTVKTFTEKPDHDMAQQFLDSGDFYWNSGIFISSIDTMDSSFAAYLPEIHSLFTKDLSAYNSEGEERFIRDTYAVCKNISMDYGIMEKAENVFVVLSDFGWSDLGTWGSLYTHLELDENGNGAIGKEVRLYESTNCIVNAPNDKLVVLQGLDDYIVVDTEKALLIVKKHDEQKIKQFVNELKADGKIDA